MKNKKLPKIEQWNIFAMDLPMVGGVLLAYTATVFFQNIHSWNLSAIGGFSIVIALHIGMYLFRERIFKQKLGLYFFVQGIIIFALSGIIKTNYQAAYLGLIPLIIAQSIQLLKDGKKILYTVWYYYAIYITTVILYKGFHDLLYSISLLMLISSANTAYGYLYSRQVRASEKTQCLLFELEAAYDKLEEATRESERRKLARDLHDTLSQGLVAVLMKLEALEANLEKGNLEKSKMIVVNSIDHTRDTLKEAREIIKDLRLQREESKDLNEAITHEIELFQKESTIETVINRNGHLPVTNVLYKNISFILREILTNVNKHAKASKVIINTSLEAEMIYIRIEDDGIGFDYFHFDRLYEHYGIIGMKERAKAVEGELLIDSHKKKGTCITLVVPVKEHNTRS